MRDGIVNGTVMDGNTSLANGQFTIQNTNDYFDYYHVELMRMVNFQLIFRMEIM